MRMRKAQIITELRRYLPEILCTELWISTGPKGTITICCTINKIIHEYNSTEENEAKVTKLLEQLLRLHFRTSVNS